MKSKNVIWIASLALAMTTLVSCSAGNSIFPDIPLSINAGEVQLSNPISIAVDTANSQIIIANSNVDFLYRQGSLMTVSVDASDPLSPALTATSAIATPNFAGAIAFDGTSAFIPFRERNDPDQAIDQVIKYAVGAGTLSETTGSGTGDNPFGITLAGTNVLVVNDDRLDIFNSDLALSVSVDLTAADTAGILNTDSTFVENIALDTLNNRAFISNRNGKILVVDLDNNTLTHTIDGPVNSRGIAFDGTFIYVVDGNPASLWILDPSRLSDPVSSPEEVDDSELIVSLISVGKDPNGIAVDSANNRAYVTNTGDHSVSVIDLSLDEEITRVSLRAVDTGLADAKEPFGVAVGTFGAVPLVFTANLGTNNVAVMNTNTLKVVKIFP